jgi:hypothetical protein
MAQGMTQPAQRGGPPPLPAGAQYWVAMDGQQAGPFDAAALKEQIRGGGVKKDTLVWSEGMAEWTAAGQVEAVAKLFASVPPPLPSK